MWSTRTLPRPWTALAHDFLFCCTSTWKSSDHAALVLFARSLFADQPMLPTAGLETLACLGGCAPLLASSLGGAGGERASVVPSSWHRNAYTRVAPVAWLEWSWRAYLRTHCLPGVGPESFDDPVAAAAATAAAADDTFDDPTVGAGPCSVDPLFGALNPSAWVTAATLTGKGTKKIKGVPSKTGSDANAATRSGDGPLEGLPPAVVLTARADPLRDGGASFAAAYTAAGGILSHVEAAGSHALPFIVDPKAAGSAVTIWSRQFH